MRDTIQTIRSFNRFYTRLLGLLNRNLPGGSLSLAEARALFEINANPGVCAAELARILGMDPAQLSRTLARLGKEGHILRQGEPAGRKALPLFITDTGRYLLARLEDAANEQAASLINDLDADSCSLLCQSLQNIQQLLGSAANGIPPSAAGVVIREADSGDLGWIISRHADYYGRKYGFSRDFEAYVLRSLAEFVQKDPAYSRVWIAEHEGRRMGSIGVVQLSQERAQLRWLLVEPRARGLGLGRKLMLHALEFCTACGYREAILWTLQTLETARTMYNALGFEILECKDGVMGGQELVEECWGCSLPLQSEKDAR